VESLAADQRSLEGSDTDVRHGQFVVHHHITQSEFEVSRDAPVRVSFRGKVHVRADAKSAALEIRVDFPSAIHVLAPIDAGFAFPSSGVPVIGAVSVASRLTLMRLKPAVAERPPTSRTPARPLKK